MHLNNTHLDWSNNSSPQFVNLTPPFFTLHFPWNPHWEKLLSSSIIMDPKLKKIPKSLRDYLFKIKTHQRTHIKLPSKKWILTSCKHPRTPSLDIDNMKNMHRQLRQRRRSHVSGHRPFPLWKFQVPVPQWSWRTRQQSRKVSRTGPHAIRFDSYRRFDESPLNLFTVTTTEAGSSSATSESEIAEEQTVIPGNCVVVLANSVNPSKDFQRSMESVVEARYVKIKYL